MFAGSPEKIAKAEVALSAAVACLDVDAWSGHGALRRG
jgi:hypothetical protein